MQTHFTEQDLEQPHLREAERVLRTCVHCGFCNATCPTYQLLGDERDGPRGRIYLMKTLLESRDDDHQATEETRLHLDRCLSCRNCETTCPSGVEYHKLLDIGRAEIERRVPRKAGERALRFGLRKALVDPRRFRALLKLGLTFKPVVPGTLKQKLPATPVDAGIRPEGRDHERQMLILEGCVQPSLSPNTNAATARVLDRLGIGLTPAPRPAAAAPSTSISTPRTPAATGRGPISTPGGRISKPAARPSSRPPAAVAPSSRNMARCSPMIRPTPTRPPASAPWPGTWWKSSRTSRSTACRSRTAGGSPFTAPAPSSMPNGSVAMSRACSPGSVFN
ncbi:succinate dehydrogenase iron-sulfur subunit [Halomonas elongata]|uniref:Succinate dehydrogenase iron-sulfur subunit n=1 Tax=Halomonas elongata TaxID=2746 RepID=A0A1B8P696_HALEL|nr:succinate dehydrogenase iron-sulfur subunit [Halomonas elongata]